MEVDQTRITMYPPRPNRKGSKQTSTLVVPKQIADALIEAKRINVGWTRCRIEKKTLIMICRKCWFYGHETNECNNKNSMAGKCINCGKDNHEAKDCKDEAKCYECAEAGHRTGSMGCSICRVKIENAKTRRGPVKFLKSSF